MIQGRLHVLVPIVREQAAAPLTDIGDALVAFEGGEGRVLALVELPDSGTPNLRGVMAERRRALLEWIASTDARRGGEHRMRSPIEIRVASDLVQGVREAVFEQDCDVLVVEWPGVLGEQVPTLRRLVERLSMKPPADLVLVRPDPARPEAGLRARRILVPVRGGANPRLALLVAEALGAASGGELTLLHVYSAAHSSDRRRREREAVLRLLETSSGRVPIQFQETVARTAGTVILDASSGYDAIVLGAFAETRGSPTLVRSALVDTVRRLPGTVIVVKAAG